MNKIPHFSVASLQMPQDVMHVLLEGVLPLNVRLMLDSFIKEGLITFDVLNDRIRNFRYGRIEARTKPPKLFEKKSNSIGQVHLSGNNVLTDFF